MEIAVTATSSNHIIIMIISSRVGMIYSRVGKISSKNTVAKTFFLTSGYY